MQRLKWSVLVCLLALLPGMPVFAGHAAFDQFAKRVLESYGEMAFEKIIDLRFGNLNLDGIGMTPELEDFEAQNPVKFDHIDAAALRVFRHPRLHRPNVSRRLLRRLMRDGWELVLHSKTRDSVLLAFVREAGRRRSEVAVLLLSEKKLILVGLRGDVAAL